MNTNGNTNFFDPFSLSPHSYVVWSFDNETKIPVCATTILNSYLVLSDKKRFHTATQSSTTISAISVTIMDSNRLDM